jgi:hypothetical protein
MQPQDFSPSSYVNQRWLEVPVAVPNSYANCYIVLTGIAVFTGDPQWNFAIDPYPPLGWTFTLTLSPPLVRGKKGHQENDDAIMPGTGIASVALASVDLDTKDMDEDADDWLFGLETVTVKPMKPDATEIIVEVTGSFKGDSMIDRIAYHLGFLVYRPTLRKVPPFTPRFPVRRDEVGNIRDHLKP